MPQVPVGCHGTLTVAQQGQGAPESGQYRYIAKAQWTIDPRKVPRDQRLALTPPPTPPGGDSGEQRERSRQWLRGRGVELRNRGPRVREPTPFAPRGQQRQLRQLRQQLILIADRGGRVFASPPPTSVPARLGLPSASQVSRWRRSPAVAARARSRVLPPVPTGRQAHRLRCRDAGAHTLSRASPTRPPRVPRPGAGGRDRPAVARLSETPRACAVPAAAARLRSGAERARSRTDEPPRTTSVRRTIVRQIGVRRHSSPLGQPATDCGH